MKKVLWEASQRGTRKIGWTTHVHVEEHSCGLFVGPMLTRNTGNLRYIRAKYTWAKYTRTVITKAIITCAVLADQATDVVFRGKMLCNAMVIMLTLTATNSMLVSLYHLIAYTTFELARSLCEGMNEQLQFTSFARRCVLTVCSSSSCPCFPTMHQCPFIGVFLAWSLHGGPCMAAMAVSTPPLVFDNLQHCSQNSS